MSFSGTWKAPEGRLKLGGHLFRYWPWRTCLEDFTVQAGATIGHAWATFPAQYAQNVDAEVGKTAQIFIGERLVFRGCVVAAPVQVAEKDDTLRLEMADDKWRMSRRIVGQYAVGTQAAPMKGFACVALDVVFNKDGRPNKKADEQEFDTGATAVFWTLKDALKLIFAHYIDTDVARLDENLLSDNYLAEPTDLRVAGMTALQAIDAIVGLSGESWGLSFAEAYSSFVCVRPGYGTQRSVQFFKPKGGGRSNSAGKWHGSEVTVGKSMLNVRDSYQVHSAPIVKETTYCTGTDQLLARNATFLDKKYAARYEVDVTKYATCNLGAALPSGARPKPWRAKLVTRRKADGTGYRTAADIAAAPALQDDEMLDAPLVWLSIAGENGTFRLCVGGFRADLERAILDFEPQVELLKATTTDKEEVAIADWSTVALRVTVATILEYPQVAISATDEVFLPEIFYEVLQKNDLVPERRQDALLPDLSGGNNARVEVADGAEELYVDVTEKLTELATAGLLASSAVETPIEVSLPFPPSEIQIGDRLILTGGRDLGATGNEVVTQMHYRIGEEYALEVKATAVAAAVARYDSGLVEALK